MMQNPDPSGKSQTVTEKMVDLNASILWQAYQRHELKYIMPLRHCRRDNSSRSPCECIICYVKDLNDGILDSDERTWEFVLSLMRESDFWTDFWSDDRETLEEILRDRELELEDNEVTRGRRNRQVGEFTFFRSIYSFWCLIESTARKFELVQSLQLPETTSATYPRYYLWDLEEQRIVHSHMVLRKVLQKARGWKMDPFPNGGELEEVITASYTYFDPDTKEQSTFRFAWPDLLATPALYFLRLVRFLVQTRGLGKSYFCLREYVPHALLDG